MLAWHEAKRLPRWAVASLPAVVRLAYSTHSFGRMTEKGIAEKFPMLNLREARIVEMRTKTFRDGLIHVLVRIPYDEGRDMVMALMPTPNYWEVKTVWLNAKSDDRNRDLSAYVD